MEYAFTHNGHAYTPSGTANVADVDKHNRELEAQELAHWATAPDHWQVYIDSNNVVATTWLGTPLGYITMRKRFRTNISRNMVAIRIKGTNGATYYGRYGADWSQLCRVRKVKG